MLEKSSSTKRGSMLVLLVLGLLGAAWARTETVLHSFCAQDGSNCPDGDVPQAGLVFDRKGNLYGTTTGGGAHGAGVAFKLTPRGEETVLHSFCTLNKCADGEGPYAGVVLDQKGNLYGTTYEGGASSGCYGYGCGVVFKLTPEGKETVLYSFCPQNNCASGANPMAGVVLDQKGNLYGTTYYGGDTNSGVVFKLTPKGKETVLHSFGGTDGLHPAAGLVFDQEGNLYGTTFEGGAHSGCSPYGPYGCGIVFKLSPKGKETALYSFCAQTNCADGANPYAGLILDRNGNLYGTTYEGGAYNSCGGGCGIVFKLTPRGREKVLYSFCMQSNCAGGAFPQAGLLLDQKGNLYGTTVMGGVYNDLCFNGSCGVAFKLSPQGKETVLYTFCMQTNCTDGELPEAGLTADRKGNLYGTTAYGGAHSGNPMGHGVIFKLTP